MKKQSAGILMYRFKDKKLQVLLVHPGGPFFKNKDQGAWSIPKGEFGEEETPQDAAIREFHEELGLTLSAEDLTALRPVKQKGGKIVFCWAVQGDFSPELLASNTFDLEWPPNSGLIRQFPEVDRADWFDMDKAKWIINEAQTEFLEELETIYRIS